MGWRPELLSQRGEGRARVVAFPGRQSLWLDGKFPAHWLQNLLRISL